MARDKSAHHEKIIAAAREEFMTYGFTDASMRRIAAAAGMSAICFLRGKRWIWPSVGVVLAMMIARNYLMAHFPRDVLAAVITGVFSG